MFAVNHQSTMSRASDACGVVKNAARRDGTLVIALTCLFSTAAAVSAAQESSSTTPESTATAIVARVETAGGHQFEFVDEGEAIGIAEIAPAGSKSNLEELIVKQKASALEVFKAAAPRDSAPPERLVQDHEQFAARTGRTGLAPRDLALTISPASYSVDEGYDTEICDYDESWTPGSSQFTNWWFWTVGLGKDFSAQQTYEYEDLNGTAGKLWYAGQSRERWLGACNGNYIFGFSAFRFRAEYRNSLGNWVTSYTTQIEPYTWVKYYSSSSPERWRVRLQEMGFNVFLNRIYAVGVAGNEPLGFVIKPSQAYPNTGGKTITTMAAHAQCRRGRAVRNSG